MTEPQIIRTKHGEISGVSIGETAAYLGIPFAAPPVGDLRFRAPQPLQPWHGVRSCKKYPQNPMQETKDTDHGLYSEDCLYLNIWVPQRRGNRPLPVMVWFYGGGYESGGIGATNGDGTKSLYEMDLFAAETNCIIVAVNYRLNVFGFLNFSFLSDRFEDNLGIKDQIAALQWVKENISCFGGNSGNITIFGESAGGGSVSVLLAIPKARELFHKAIMQSNCFDSVYTRPEQEHVSRKFLEYLGIRENNVLQLLECSYDELYTASKKWNPYILEQYPARCVYCPAADGELLSVLPVSIDPVKTGIPVMIGYNHDEGNLVSFTDKRIKDRGEYAKLIVKNETQEKAAKILGTYPSPPSKQGFGEMLTDVIYTQPLYRFAESYCLHDPIYIYRLDYYPPLLALLGLNACHGADVPLLFGKLDMLGKNYYVGNSGGAHTVGRRMRKYWGAFAHGGKPEPEGLPAWPVYEKKARRFMAFGKKDRLLQDFNKEKIAAYHMA